MIIRGSFPFIPTSYPNICDCFPKTVFALWGHYLCLVLYHSHTICEKIQHHFMGIWKLLDEVRPEPFISFMTISECFLPVSWLQCWYSQHPNNLLVVTTTCMWWKQYPYWFYAHYWPWMNVAINAEWIPRYWIRYFIPKTLSFVCVPL